MRRSKRHISSSLAFFLLFYGVGEGQVKISGPACVVPGTVYQYIISGTWDSSATMHVQLTGGYMADSSNGKVAMFSGRFSRQLLVVWNDSVSNTRSLSLTSAVGNSSLTIAYTSRLKPGLVDGNCMTQRVGLDLIPGTPITCALATGGACSPTYRYQWQQSADRTHWKDVSGATAQNLQVRSPVRRSLYYRRKVTESSTGSVGYSNEAAVFLHVDALLPDSTLKAIRDSAAATSGNAFPRGKNQYTAAVQPANKREPEKPWLSRSNPFFTRPKEEPFHG